MKKENQKKESLEQKKFKNGVAVKAPKKTVKSLLAQEEVKASDFTAVQIDRVNVMQSELDLEIQALMDRKNALKRLTAENDFQLRLKFSAVNNPVFKSTALRLLHDLNNDIGLPETRDFFRTELKSDIKKTIAYNKAKVEAGLPDEQRALPKVVRRTIGKLDLGDSIGGSILLTLYEMEENHSKTLTTFQLRDLWNSKVDLTLHNHFAIVNSGNGPVDVELPEMPNMAKTVIDVLSLFL